MEPAISKASISFRIATQQWMPEQRFSELLEFFSAAEGLTDELSLFTSETHAPLPLDVVKARAELLSRRISAARSAGFRVGINILTTIGHHEENLANSLSGDFVNMTDIEGRACRGSLCPNDENARAYVADVCACVAEVKPDFIWIDDDVRLMNHLPIHSGCFCDRCLSLFAERYGRGFTRKTLREAFDLGTTEMKLGFRKAWIDHNRRTMHDLLGVMERAIHRVRPGLPLGFMTEDMFFEGYDFAAWAEALSGAGKVEVRWRPGGGFYNDARMLDLIGKSHECGRQVSRLPSGVIAIQSEIENFPYQTLMKAARTTALEAASHVAAGCTGAAFNVLSKYDEPLEEYAELVSVLRAWRPFYDYLAQLFARQPPIGVWQAWGSDFFAANNLTEGEWLGPARRPIEVSSGEEIFRIGIPAAYSQVNGCVALLTGDSVVALDSTTLRQSLSSGVYLDAQALTQLNALGYGHLTGFTVDHVMENDCIEVLSEDPLNGGFSRRKRDSRQSFWWKQPAACLQPCDGDARVLSRLVDYGGREVAACCLGLYENELGGRICVAGYYPWTLLQSKTKSRQVKAILRWLSRDTLPAYVDSFHRVNLWMRNTEDGGMALCLVNTSMDCARDLVLMVRSTERSLRLVDSQCKATDVGATASEGPYQRFVVSQLGSWEMTAGVLQPLTRDG